jgi:hypothetical protein
VVEHEAFRSIFLVSTGTSGIHDAAGRGSSQPDWANCKGWLRWPHSPARQHVRMGLIYRFMGGRRRPIGGSFPSASTPCRPCSPAAKKLQTVQIDRRARRDYHPVRLDCAGPVPAMLAE